MNRRNFILTVPIAASVALTIRSVVAQEAARPTNSSEARAARRLKQAARALMAGLSPEERSAVLFGDPATSEPWGWLLTGHHLGATFTVAKDRVAFLPLFVGAAPNEIVSGAYAGAQVLSHEASLAYDFLQALSPDQIRLAVLSPN